MCWHIVTATIPHPCCANDVREWPRFCTISSLWSPESRPCVETTGRTMHQLCCSRPEPCQISLRADSNGLCLCHIVEMRCWQLQITIRTSIPMLQLDQSQGVTYTSHHQTLPSRVGSANCARLRVGWPHPVAPAPQGMVHRMFKCSDYLMQHTV